MPDGSRRRLVHAHAAIALGSLLLVAAIWTIVQERVAFEYGQSVRDVENENANLSLLLEERTRALMENVDQALHFLRRQYTIEREMVNPAQILQDMGVDTSAIRAITILGPDRQAVRTPAAGNAESRIENTFFAEIANDDSDTLHISRTRPEPRGGWGIDVARRIINTDGSFGGAIVATVDPVQVSSFYRQTSLGPHDVVVLIGTDGFARLRHAGDRISFGEDYRNTPPVLQAARVPVGRFQGAGGTDGIPRLFTYRALRGYPLIVAVGAGQEDAFASFRGHRRSYYAVASLATLAVVVLAIVLMRALLRQRRALEAIVRNEARFHATFDQAFVGMAQSTPEGRIFQVNRRLADITGWPEHELLGRTFADIVHPEDRGGDAAGMTAPAERRLLRKDGRIAWANIATTQVSDSKGGRDCLVTVVQDITEFKRIDLMKSEFVSIVSHELRTPLTSIRGSLGLIAGGVAGALPEAARNLIDIAKNNCERLIRLINDILDTEKIESGKMTFDLREVDLVALAEATISANQAFAAQHRVGLRLVAAETPLRVRVDADRLTQVVTNLISNAVKFSPKGGEVEIALARRGDRVRMEVRDRGPGIPPEFRERLFQKFSQADSSDTRQKGGTGLGLNISKAIIERLGGEIGFETRMGSGTTFHFELPAASAARSSAPASTSLRPRILVCEDDPDIARLIGMMLDKAGYDADLAHTAAEARRMVLEGGHAAITVDLELPDEPGISLIRTLRREPATHELPVIVISATADEGRIQLNGERLPVADWLGKPIDENRLVLAVRRAVSGSADERPRILHVEDDPDIQRIAAAIAQDFATFEFAAGLDEARALLRKWRFELVLLDLRLPDGSGWDLLPDIALVNPPPPVVVFSIDEADEQRRKQVAAVLLKANTSNEDLLETIRRVLRDASPRDRA